MSSRWKLALLSLSAPMLLMQLNLQGCLIPLTSGGGTAVGGGQIFNLPPTPIITADITRGVAPLTVQFSSSSSTDDGLIISRRWDFANGQTSPDISPRTTFEQTGTFNVVLTIRDDSGASASKSITIVVTQAPIPSLGVDRTAAASAPAVFSFDASGSVDPDGQIVAYRWDFGDGSREVLPVVTHTYASAGTFRVRLTVTDSAGVTATAELLIDVGIPRPSIEFRQPPASVTNLVLSPDSPLWVYAEFTLTPGTPRMLKAGLDGDKDACDAQAVAYSQTSGAEITRLQGLPDAVTAVAVSPNGQFLVTGSQNGSIDVFNAGTLRLLNEFGSDSGAVASLAFSPDSSRIAVGHAGGRVLIRARSTGLVERTILAHASGVNAVAYSGDGSRVASAGDDNRAIVFESSTGAQVSMFEGHTGPVTSIVFNPVNATQVLTGSEDETARLWNATSGAQIGVFRAIFSGSNLLFGHTNSINAVDFSSDGAKVLTASDDRTAIVWSTASLAADRTFSGHADRVTAAAFSPDNSQILTGGADGSVRLWNVQTGEQVQSSTPCTSTVASVAFSTDGSTYFAGVAAANGIQLDGYDRNGNDLNATAPLPLDLRAVPAGQYSLWIELATDRSEPARTYSPTTINIVDSFTSDIQPLTPRIPLIGDRASVLVKAGNDRQIFDLGPFATGDLVDVSLLSVPGYRRIYNADPFSVLMLDSAQEMFAWYQSGFVLFTPNSRPTFGHSTSNLYVVVDQGSSVDVRIQRAVGSQKRAQRVFLDFRGNAGVAVGGYPPLSIQPFRAQSIDPSFTDTDTANIRNLITTTARSFYAPWNVDITSSDEGPPPSPPYQTVYFGASNPNPFMFIFGLADYIDPRNATLTGSALVYTNSIASAIQGQTPDFYGQFIGWVTAHEVGHLCGLRHVSDPTDLMCGDGLDPFSAVTPSFKNSPIIPREIPNGAIGTQNAPALLDEVFGLR